MGVPLLFGPAMPCIEHTEANLTVVVQIRIKAHRAPARCLQINHHRIVGVVRGEVNVEFEAAICIGRVSRSRDKDLHYIQSISVAAYEYTATVRQWERRG